MAAKLTDNKTEFCHSIFAKSLARFSFSILRFCHFWGISILYLYLAVIEAFYYCKGLNVYPFFAEQFAAGLESFLNEECHSYNLSPCLCGKVENAKGGIAVGKEIVDKKATFALLQVAVAKAYIV